MKKTIFTLCSFALLGLSTVQAQVKVGDNPTIIAPSAILEIESAGKGFLPPRMTTANRNAINNPVQGLVIYNTEQNCLNFYDGVGWVNICGTYGHGGDVVETIMINGNYYRIHQFTSTGISNFEVIRPGEVDYLIVAGGGGGASRHGGGGGAGGLLTSFGGTALSLQKGTYNIVVGNGGNGSPSGSSTTGNKGENSSAFNLVAFGGGAGGGTNNKSNDQDGGSGGGSRGNSTAAGGTGSPGQGQNGGQGRSQDVSVNFGLGGGGGGYSQVGFEPNSSIGFRGRGGDGFDASPYLGTTFGDDGWFAGGGGSGSMDVPLSAGNIGGKGGGGNGNTNSLDNATPGTNGTGGGGAGGGHYSTNFPGKNGGSGTVIIRYRIDQ